MRIRYDSRRLLYPWRYPFCTAVVLLSLGFGSGARADAVAEVLTLEQALALALQDNRRLENADMEVGKASDGVAAERTRRLPKLHLDVSESYNLSPETYEFSSGASGQFPQEHFEIEARDGYSTVVSASVKQPLSELYKIGLSIDQHELDTDIAGQQLRARRLDVVADVKKTYYNILKTRNQLTSIGESIAFYRELDRLVERYYAEQTVLEYETMEVKSRLARAEHDAYRERNRLATQQEELNRLLGRDVRTPFSVSPVGVSTLPVPTQAAAEDAAVTRSPEIYEARLKLDHAEYGYRIKKSDYLPDIGLQYRYTRLYNTEFIPDKDSSVGLTARWEFYDWGRKSEELGKKRLAIRQARNEKAEIESRVVMDVNHRRRELEDAVNLVGVAGITVEAMQEKLRVMMNRYRQQAVLLDDVLQAEKELTAAKTEYNNAQLSVWTAQAELHKTMGEE